MLTRGSLTIELWRGEFDVLVDGTTVGSIVHSGTLETPVESGSHTLLLRRGRYSSESRSFDAADNEVVNFRCHGAAVWPRWVASLVKPDLAIALRRE
jgi:hypothetical protein